MRPACFYLGREKKTQVDTVEELCSLRCELYEQLFQLLNLKIVINRLHVWLKMLVKMSFYNAYYNSF